MQALLDLTCQNNNKKMISMIQNVTESHILHLVKNDIDKQKIDEIISCLKVMLNGNYEKYNFDEDALNKINNSSLCEKEIQKVLSRLNEKQAIRKSNGVYYTQKDVVSFIVNNCFNQRVSKNTQIISKLSKKKDKLQSVIYNDFVFDPTCGTGEFLLGALEKKINLIKNENTGITDKKLSIILKTIFGNDINIESIEIAKIRLFFEIVQHAKSIESYRYFAEIINSNMTCRDFVNASQSDFKKYDIIIGNPPYVEDRKSSIKPNIHYGNIYANVLQNSIDMLTKDGVLGFVVPISYISTQRMKKIRKYVETHTCHQFVLNYADRPDCLFTSVHQKLSIIFAVKGRMPHQLYTTGYKYWYKNERIDLFNCVDIIHNEHTYDNFYPKLGNYLEHSIFGKVFTITDDNILAKNTKKEPNIYLNMRACFWIKSFSFNPGSKEYKGFSYDEDMKYIILCILNSSLYFLFWNIISDCWHITSKELKHFRVPNSIENTDDFKNLYCKLENKLEQTKKYIGTKQTNYEYKHKMCKDIIDEIDGKLAEIYNLTLDELEYVKSYSSKYRESLGG